MISVKNLTKKYNKTIILENINVDFENRINLLIGDNGAGKTTLINIIAGVVKADIGEIYIQEKKISYSDGSYRKNIGFLLGMPHYPYHLKIREYIDLLNTIYSIQKNNMYYQDELISFLGLNKYLDYKISTLSEGYLKRIKILSAMIHNPDFFIFDEPFSGLDEVFLISFIKRIILLSKKGKGFLITTHLSKIDEFSEGNPMIYHIHNNKIESTNEN